MFFPIPVLIKTILKLLGLTDTALTMSHGSKFQ